MRGRMFLAVMALMLAVAGLAGCAWKPEVTAVPITAPWSDLGLPVQENTVVWASEEKKFKAVHKDSKKAVMEAYVEALKAKGWTLGKLDSSSERYNAEMSKDGEKLMLEFYDFDNTGVIIEVAEPESAPTPAR